MKRFLFLVAAVACFGIAAHRHVAHGDYLDVCRSDDRNSRWSAEVRIEKAKERYNRRSRILPPITNAAYRENCGSCHFPYQPDLLPHQSWSLIMGGLDNHFGQSLAIDKEDRQTIKYYLQERAAQFSPSRLSRRLVRSLEEETPLRISQVPYIRREHRRLIDRYPAVTTKTPLSDCSTCHYAAEEGVYDDDYVLLP